MRIPIAAAALCLIAAAPSAAQRVSQFQAPIPASQVYPKPVPVYPSAASLHTPEELAAVRQALASGKLDTLRTWTGSFSVAGTQYNYTLLGARPNTGIKTTIPTVIVPIRLTVPDFSKDGKTPVVFDGRKAVPSMMGSPLFTPSLFTSGYRQFGDAMLHADFPKAPKSWELRLSATIAPVLDITAPKGTVKVIQAKSGKLVGIIMDGSIINKPIAELTRANFSPQDLVIFVTYNALENEAFGYHSFLYAQQKSQALVYIYTSWFEGIGDALGIPSPDAVTLTHEVAETIHDPLITSLTKEWGDPFRNNRCFQPYIEVGDVIEFAPVKIQYWGQWGTINGKPHEFTIQNEALLPWFERQTPSHALNHAYSFPGNQTLPDAAPLDCRK